MQIMNGLLYTLGKFARFLIDFGMVYILESPLFSQNGKYYYPSDPTDPKTTLPIGINPSKPFERYKGLGSISKQEVYDVFFNPNTRRLIQVTPQGLEYTRALMENIDNRKRELSDAGLLINPYNIEDFKIQ